MKRQTPDLEDGASDKGVVSAIRKELRTFGKRKEKFERWKKGPYGRLATRDVRMAEKRARRWGSAVKATGAPTPAVGVAGAQHAARAGCRPRRVGAARSSWWGRGTRKTQHGATGPKTCGTNRRAGLHGSFLRHARTSATLQLSSDAAASDPRSVHRRGRSSCHSALLSPREVT